MAGSLIFRASSARSFERDEAGIRWRKSELGWREVGEEGVREEGNSSFMRGVLNFPSVTGHRSTGRATTTAGSSIRGVCRQERVRQGWMDIEACRERRKRRDAKEKLQTLALDLFQTAYRAFRTSYSP